MVLARAEKISPKVSVILTSYNHAAYVAASIESVLSQTFADFELLIVDDGSRDNSREIIKTFDDPRIKFFLYEENRGSNIAVREALNSARGKYIAVQHSDDLWTPEKLERQIAYLDAHEDCAACFTFVEFVDEQGNSNELDAADSYKNVFDKLNRPRAEWLNYFFYNANCLCHPSAVVRRAAYDEYKIFDLHGYWQLPDLLIWIRLCFHAEIFILPERLTKFRLRRARQENTSATSYDKLVRADLEFFFIAKEIAAGFDDDKFFLEVFPEAERFLVDGQINRHFALAQLYLEKKSVASAAFHLAGLELLKNLLDNPTDAAQIKNLYGYDEKTFLRDGGSFDVFNLAQKNSMLRTEIFYVSGGDYFRAAEKIVNVDTSRKFYGRFDFDLSRPTKVLRFDPATNFISVKVIRVLINGDEQKISRDNSSETVGGFRRFWTSDPQIFFDVENLSGHVTFEIFGETEENYPVIISRTLNDLTARNEQLLAENRRLTAENESVWNLNSWKVTNSFREWLKLSGREKVLSAVHIFYRALPLNAEQKESLKDKFYSTFAPLLKNTRRYKNWQLSCLLRGATPAGRMNFIQIEEKSFGGELETQPGKIAIQAHIFYLDLLDEMAAHCANMPYKFDALVSIVDATAEEKVRAAFKKISNVDKCIVRVVPNRGRDVAPFIAGFGDLLPKYDFVLHIHSKKSLYTGAEQQNWRNYLLDALLGTQSRIRKIFRAFLDDKSVGVIYPRPAENVPYVAFTWLSNRAQGRLLLNRAGIAPNKTEYFDFPAGTMFWARTKALQKFFALGLTFEDFPPEQGQNDGTIAHAFERSVLLAAQSEEMNFYEFDPATENYSVNLGSKNLWQYFSSRNGSETELQWLVAQGEIISFDVFDTLLMRYVAVPALVNEIIRLKVEDLLGKSFDFPKFRLRAEELARRDKGGDVTLDEIYRSFSQVAELDADTCKKIRELEISTEVKLSLPREAVVDWFKKILKSGRKIWLISDMYMQTPDLERLLKKCGVEGYEKLLISCETGMRKDTAAIWNHFAEKKINLVHVGDNETSDMQLPNDRKIFGYHLMSAFNMLTLTPFGKMLAEGFDLKNSLYAGICLGVVLAKKLQSPFALSRELTDRPGKIVLKNFRDLGYWFFGPPLLTFILWLIKTTREDGTRRIFFLARDGYFLRPLYKLVTETLNVEPLPSEYFYASRRAVTVASVREISHAEDILKLNFDGTLKQFFKVRFGLELGDDTKISLPDESFGRVKKIIAEHAEEILSRVEMERTNYKKYIDGLGGALDKVGLVDMGYSGTIQYHLQRLAGKNFTGYYFATNAKNLFGAAAHERMRGCFAENDMQVTTKSAVYKYHLLFESFLTAPDAQLLHFDAEGKPIFGAPEVGQIHFDELEEINAGVKDFFSDVLEIFGDVLLRVPLDKKFIDAWVSSFVRDGFIIAPNLRAVFDFDDLYCNGLHGNALDFYRQSMNL